ncbi:MAG: ATP-binding protein [Erysipelotrichaceae bacterium]|nr:ATP-binding protein [Erysipelotrichaceae bacterium]
MCEVQNMLLNYSVKGYKVFYDKVEFSMIADNYIKKNRENLIKNVANKFDLVKSAFIYGANNTGKTCFLESLHFFINLIKSEQIILEKYDKNIFYNRKDDLEFKIDFSDGDDIYSYEITFSKERIKQEIFIKNNEVLLNREKPDRELTKILELIGENNEKLYLFRLSQKHKKSVETFLNFLNKFEFLNNSTNFDVSEILDNNSFNEINSLIKNFDFSIDTLIDATDIVNEIKKEQKIDEEILEKLRLFVKYNFKNFSEEIPFGIIDSTGTKKTTKFIYTFLNAIKNNKILIIDEIESSLHTLVTKALIAYYNSHDNTNSQLIATSHDLLLLDDKYLLRKDQIWFIHKDNEGNYLYSLSDFKENSENDTRGNVMIKYLKGLFGALPEPKWFDD